MSPARGTAVVPGDLALERDDDDLQIRPRVDRMERTLIARAMERTAGNQTKAAELLGLSRYGLQKKLRRLSEPGKPGDSPEDDG
jgi:transcriptional regulator with GAF, ATPase, and Fis domain